MVIGDGIIIIFFGFIVCFSDFLFLFCVFVFHFQNTIPLTCNEAVNLNSAAGLVATQV